MSIEKIKGELRRELYSDKPELPNSPMISSYFRPEITICLNSVGGSYVEGLSIMQFVLDNYLGTVVRKSDICFSACALVFLAGSMNPAENYRFSFRHIVAGGRLGFHAPYGMYEGKTFQGKEVEEIVRIGNLTTSWLLENTIEADVPITLIAEMLKYKSDQMLEIDTPFKARRWKIEIVGLLKSKIKFDKIALSTFCENNFLYKWPVYVKPYQEKVEYPSVNKVKIEVKKMGSGKRYSVLNFPPEGLGACNIDVPDNADLNKATFSWNDQIDQNATLFLKGQKVKKIDFFNANLPLTSLMESR